jgi:hypothetical protein
MKLISMATITSSFVYTFGLLTSTPANAAIIGGQLFSTGENIQVRVLGGTAAITSYLSLYSPEVQYIATNQEVGRVIDLGSFPKGEELIFGINANGNIFRTGPGSRNSDGIAHAGVTFLAPNVAQVGFEDLWGGGDRDYDDNNFVFSGGISATQNVPEPSLLLGFLGLSAFAAHAKRKRIASL